MLKIIAIPLSKLNSESLIQPYVSSFIYSFQAEYYVTS